MWQPGNSSAIVLIAFSGDGAAADGRDFAPVDVFFGFVEVK